MARTRAPRDAEISRVEPPEISPDDETKLDELLDADVEMNDERLDELAAGSEEQLDRLLEDVG